MFNLPSSNLELVGADSYKQNVPCIVHSRTADAGC
jgi:hypothetical protein